MKVRNTRIMNVIPTDSDYLEANRQTYDALAEQYRDRIKTDRVRDRQLVDPFLRFLRVRFPNTAHRILDAGCGNGLNLAMFEEEGCLVTGIDMSKRMLEVARQTCPSAKLLEGNILNAKFGIHNFHGVFAKALIHLFPASEIDNLFQRFWTLLIPNGILYVTTTIEAGGFEGFRKKDDYSGGLARFRRSWSEEELLSAVKRNGFKIFNTSSNTEPERDKVWFNVWAEKQNK